MKSHCRESVGFHLEPICDFSSDLFMLSISDRFFSEIYNLDFLSFPPSSVMILLAFLSCFLVFFLLR